MSNPDLQDYNKAKEVWRSVVLVTIPIESDNSIPGHISGAESTEGRAGEVKEVAGCQWVVNRYIVGE